MDMLYIILHVEGRDIEQRKESRELRTENNQGLVEYALILVLEGVVVIAVLLTLGPIIGNVFTKINSSLVAQ